MVLIASAEMSEIVFWSVILCQLEYSKIFMNGFWRFVKRPHITSNLDDKILMAIQIPSKILNSKIFYR